MLDEAGRGSCRGGRARGDLVRLGVDRFLVALAAACSVLGACDDEVRVLVDCEELDEQECYQRREYCVWTLPAVSSVCRNVCDLEDPECGDGLTCVDTWYKDPIPEDPIVSTPACVPPSE